MSPDNALYPGPVRKHGWSGTKIQPRNRSQTEGFGPVIGYNHRLECRFNQFATPAGRDRNCCPVGDLYVVPNPVGDQKNAGCGHCRSRATSCLTTYRSRLISAGNADLTPQPSHRLRRAHAVWASPAAGRNRPRRVASSGPARPSPPLSDGARNGQGGIRTRGTPCEVRRFSKPVPSAARPPVRRGKDTPTPSRYRQPLTGRPGRRC